MLILARVLNAVKHLSKWPRGHRRPIGKRGVVGWIPGGDIYFHFDFFACFSFLTALRSPCKMNEIKHDNSTVVYVVLDPRYHNHSRPMHIYYRSIALTSYNCFTVNICIRGIQPANQPNFAIELKFQSSCKQLHPEMSDNLIQRKEQYSFLKYWSPGGNRVQNDLDPKTFGIICTLMSVLSPTSKAFFSYSKVSHFSGDWRTDRLIA